MDRRTAWAIVLPRLAAIFVFALMLTVVAVFLRELHSAPDLLLGVLVCPLVGWCFGAVSGHVELALVRRLGGRS